MVHITMKGNFDKTETFLSKLKQRLGIDLDTKLNVLGQKGVDALAAATPVRSGLTASSWSYDVIHTDKAIQVRWKNSNFNKNVPIAMVIQYGHGTGWGGYVEGIDYINPAMRPIFDELIELVRKEVRS